MNPTETLMECFQKKAEAVSAVVTRVASARAALDYVVNLCEHKGGLPAAGGRL